MIIKTKEILTTLKGQPLIADDTKEPLTVGDAVANYLISDREGGKMKCFILAQKFVQQDSVELDDADLALVKAAVKNPDVYNNLVGGQILLKLEKEEKPVDEAN